MEHPEKDPIDGSYGNKVTKIAIIINKYFRRTKVLLLLALYAGDSSSHLKTTCHTGHQSSKRADAHTHTHNMHIHSSNSNAMHKVEVICNFLVSMGATGQMMKIKPTGVSCFMHWS